MVSSCHPSPPSALSSLLPEVCIPAGSFRMGGIEEDKFVTEVELPTHEVVISQDFSMTKTPVTRTQWQEIMGALPDEGCLENTENLPVVSVSFFQAMAFCERLGNGYRLPTEAEWEYACRAGSSSVFPSRSNLSTEDANYLYDEGGHEIGRGTLLPVGSYPANDFGLFDMIGNVCEWTADPWHPSYRDAPTDGQAWLENGKSGCRVIRGGAWDHLPRVLRASWRDWAPEQARWDNLGFRVVRTISHNL